MGLPEIVAAIMEELNDRQSLFAALQVNKLWADEATMVLWREDPSIQSLIRISNIERRQYYADRISSLKIIGSDDPQLDSLVNIYFPRLTKLFTHHPYKKHQQYISDFLQPNLESIVLSLSMLRPPLPLGGLVRLFDYMPSLTHIKLHYIGYVELYSYFASRPKLQEFRMSGPMLTEDATMRILATVTNPYPKLRRLSWHAHGKAFCCLARHLSSLSVLKLTLEKASDDTLFVISDCTSLAVLNVRFLTYSQVPADGLLAIARKCSHLRVFELAGNVDGGSITDDVVRQVATYLPKMTCFRLWIETKLTITALLYLGDQCTKLTDCSLKGDFNLEQLCRPNLTPLFPQLEELELRRVSGNVAYERAVSIILQQFPQISVSVPNPYSSPQTWDRRVWLTSRRV